MALLLLESGGVVLLEDDSGMLLEGSPAVDLTRPGAFDFTERARPIVEVGISATALKTAGARWDVAQWDHVEAVWSGVEPIWVDVSCEGIEDVHIDVRRTKVMDPFVPGRCEVAINNESGWADPVVAEVPGTFSMRPGLPIRVGIEHTTLGTVWRFRGFVDSIDPIYDAEEGDTVTLRCLDAFGETSRAKLADTVEVGADETVSARIGRILDAALWPDEKRLIAAQSTPLVAAAMEGQAADLLTRAVASAGAWVFADTDGNIVAPGIQWLYYTADDPVDATIGNVDAGDVCPSGWRLPFDRGSITTRVILDRLLPTGATPTDPIVYDDHAAQLAYGIEPYEALDLWTRDDVDMDRIAYRVLGTRSAATSPRIEYVDLDAATGDDVVDLLTVVSLTTPSRYRCRLDLGRLVFDAEYFAVGISEDISREGWTARISLDRADLYEVTTDANWDTTGRWDRSLWN